VTTQPEAVAPHAQVVIPIENAAMKQGKDAYASLYEKLAAEMKPLGPQLALEMLPTMDFATPKFTNFAKRIRLSSKVHGLADEDAFHAGVSRFSRLSARLPFRPSFVRYSAQSSDDEALFATEDAAYAWLASKMPVTRSVFDRLALHEAAQALTVAGLTEEAIRNIVQPALMKVLAGEMDFQGFLSAMKNEPFGIGGLLSPQAHMETVYRTNIMAAYNHGHVEYGASLENSDIFPGAEIYVVVDERTSDICRPLAGMRVPREMVLSGRFCPPFHYNCRTTIVWVISNYWQMNNKTLTAGYWEAAPEAHRILPGFGYFTTALAA
jgi:hypothetical protein